MKLSLHPDYHTHIQALANRQQYQTIVEAWKKSGTSIAVPKYALSWTLASARAFVRTVSDLFQSYNNVLWNQFPFCRTCAGGCCVPEACSITSLDALALALLDLPVPDLPDQIAASERACVYLVDTGCVWSAEWRPVKCWTFYCTLGEPADAVIAALEEVISGHLPEILIQYRAVHGDWPLDSVKDPIELANAFDVALSDVFVTPIDKHYPELHNHTSKYHSDDEPQDGTSFSRAVDALVSIAQAAERIGSAALFPATDVKESADRFLSDAEHLEWILLGRPERAAMLLAEMLAHYAAAPACQYDELVAIWCEMRSLLQFIIREWGQMATIAHR